MANTTTTPNQGQIKVGAAPGDCLDIAHGKYLQQPRGEHRNDPQPRAEKSRGCPPPRRKDTLERGTAPTMQSSTRTDATDFARTHVPLSRLHHVGAVPGDCLDIAHGKYLQQPRGEHNNDPQPRAEKSRGCPRGLPRHSPRQIPATTPWRTQQRPPTTGRKKSGLSPSQTCCHDGEGDSPD